MGAVKKILFVIPPYFNIDDYVNNETKSKEPVFTIPYGVLSIISYLKKNSKFKTDVQVLDLNLQIYNICNKTSLIDNQLSRIIEDAVTEMCPEIVAISALFNTCYTYLENITVTVRKSCKNSMMVIGGGLATNLYDKVLDSFSLIEAACYGEGEIPFCELINSDDYSKLLKTHPSWITRESYADIEPKHSFVHNLDGIPFFDYKLINLQNYNGRSLDKSNVINNKELSIHTSRGCPFNCIFCANGKVHGKKVRYMSVNKVIFEVQKMIEVYGINVLLIEDDHFLSNKKRAKEILKRLASYNLRIEFPNGMAVYAIDEEIGFLLKKAGVTTVALAVESGSDYVLKNIINKPLKASLIKGTVEILRKNEINVHAFIVVGLPGELEVHREETLNLINEVGFDWVYFFIAIPIAGSRLYELCKEKGYLASHDHSKDIITRCNINHPDIDPSLLEEKVYLMNLCVNFVKNYNTKMGNYKKAFLYFNNVAMRYPEHAFAHYFLHKVHEKLNDKYLSSVHHKRFIEIINNSSEWKKYSEQFGLK